jgi:hypothetical protein
MRLFCWIAMVALCLVVSGCAKVNTATPDAKQVAMCRQLMGINSQLEIEPLGYYFSASLDDFHRFEFIAKTDDPAELFEKKSIDSSEFEENFKDRVMDRGMPSSWWQMPEKGLSGGSFLVKRSGINWRQGVWFQTNEDGTLTVYTVMESG